MFTRAIFKIHATWQWTHSGKRLRMCEIVCWWRKHMAQIESWKNKHIDGLYTKTTQKGEFSKLCVTIKKRCYTDLLHFSTCKHNLVSFFGRIIFWQWNCIIVFYIYFFQEKMLGDVSFKLETKIINSMSGFFLKNYNQINSSVVK